MPLADTAETALHFYPYQQGAAMTSWHPTPSPYNENADQRGSSQDLAHQQSYQPPQAYPPPPSRDGPPYAADPSYNRQGSASAPTRSPAEGSHPLYHPPVTTSHEPAYYPQQGHPEFRSRNPYGAPEAQPNGTHPPLHVATGHDMMPGQPGGPPSHYAPPSSAGPPPTPGSYYFDYGSQQRRKPVRAAQACDSCRQRKAKCDEGRPECQHCKDNGLKCSYREIPPQKSEKQVLAITERLESLHDSVNMLVDNAKTQADTAKTQDDKIQRLIDNSKSQDDKIQKLIDMLPFLPGQGNAPRKAYLEDQKPSADARQQTPRPAMIHYKSEDSQVNPPAPNPNQSFNSAPGDLAPAETDENNTLEFALPPKHTTAAHNLLGWPSIKALIPKSHKTSYVMDTESERGLLRLYGCGEGEDKGDGHEGASSPAGSSSSDGRRLDDDNTSSSSPHGVWGSGQLHAPATSTQSHSAREHAGGVSPNGGLMLDSDAVDRYFRSYMENMHILHPFLEPKVLRSMIHTFKRKYSWDYRMQQPMGQTLGAKRKRDMTDSPTSMDEFAATHQASRSRTRPLNPTPIIEHSVANAIVLLVMALGKVCTHKEPIPGPVSTSSMPTSTPHTMYSDLPMPVSAPTSPFTNQVSLNGNNMLSVSSPANPQGKNMDAIPGLAYFAKAADILGELPGGVDVSHIQANLLAGLYMGQLARVFPSHYYISNACKACQILIESTAYTQDDMKPARKNLINFAFWTCLQLESDILAEVDLPPSGITRFEGKQHKEIPTGVTLEQIPETGNQADILRFYSYQIQLRRTMNSVHSSLYRHDKNQNQKPSQVMMTILNQNLDEWRNVLGDWNWDDDDHESPDINVARMRAKYYGAKYIIHRPAIRYALSVGTPSTPSTRHSDSPTGQGLGSQFPSPAVPHNYVTSAPGRRSSEMGPPGRGGGMIERDILEAAKKCVEAAIRSTTAFDRVPPRLIITNIFGTAHAQFGNVLVLSATYMSHHPELSCLVEEKTLRHLFDRTIRILQQHEVISPVLGKDAKILQHVRQNVFPTPLPPNSATSSFSAR